MKRIILTIILILILGLSGISKSRLHALTPNNNSNLSKEQMIDLYKPIDDVGINSDLVDGDYLKKDMIKMVFNIHGYDVSYPYAIEYSCDSIDLKKTKEYTSNSSFSFEFSNHNDGEHIIKIIAYNDDFSYEYYIYVFSIEKYNFISSVSITQAKRQYFLLLYENKIIAKEQYNEIVFGYEKNDSIEDFLGDKSDLEDFQEIYVAPSYLYIYGYIEFKDCNNNIIPAANLQVSVYDEDIFGFKQNLGVRYTNEDGSYIFRIENDLSIFENGYDIILEIKLKNDFLQVQDLFQVYEYEYGTFNNVNDEFLNINHTFSYNDEMGKAVNLFEAGNLGFEYVKSVDFIGLESLNEYSYLGIEYPYGESTCWYLPVYSEIYIGSSGVNNYMWDTLLHEFGHYIEDMNDFSYFYPASHSMSMDLIDVFGKTIGTQLAWSEGLAHYFSIASQVYTNALSLNVSNVGDTLKGVFDLENVNSPSSNYLVGEGNEYVIAMLLYDIADNIDDGYDSISIGHNNFFEILESMVYDIQSIDPDDRLWNFSQFYNLLCIPTSDQGSLNDLMSYYYISAKLNSTPVSLYNLPSFSWNEQGGIISNINDDFTLYIWDNAGQLLMNPIHIGDNDLYSLDDNEWNTVLSSGVEEFLWAISSIQTDSPITGPYLSETQTISLPTAIEIQENIYLNGILLFAGQYRWYQFTPSSSGTYTFYSSGDTDTYADFFYHLVSRTTIYDRIAFDNDSGVQNNFRKTLYLYSGQTIYIRVCGYNWTETGPYTITAYKQLM